MVISGERLKYLRQLRNITQDQLGEKLGIIKQNISLWENGRKSVPVKYYTILEELFGDEIFEEEPEEQKNTAPPKVYDTIRNTPELRECIKDAMMRKGLTTAEDLNSLIDYDSVHTLERLLSGKLNFFPDILSAIFDKLDIKHDTAPITAEEREMLSPEGLYNNGAILIRPIPVVAWCNAAGHISMLASNGNAMRKWDPATTETVAAPVGSRRDTQAFRVTGVSMEPTILDNDVLYCEPCSDYREIPSNKIVILKFSDHSDFADCVVCKRFRKIGEKILLTSDNPNKGAGRDFEIDPEDIAWIGIVTSKRSLL